MRGVPGAPAAVAIALVVAACGGGSSSKSSGGAQSTTASHATTSGSSGSGTSSLTTGPVRGRLIGESHSPKIKTNWVYTVTVTDPSGHPLSGTVVTEFTFGGQVVGRETPPTHKLTGGRLHDTIQFPAPSLGQPLAVQTVVHTPKGSITLSWPVTPTR